MDLLLHAWDQPTSHTYAIISSDRDAASVIATLEMRGYNVILLSPAGTHPDLTSQASIQLDWARSILGVSGQAGVFDDIYEDFRPNRPTTSAPPLSSQFRRESFSLQQETTAAPIPHQSPRGNPVIPSGPKGSPSSLKLGLEFSRTLGSLPQGANATRSGSTLANVFTPPVGSVYHYNGTLESIPTSLSKGKGRLTTSNSKDSETKFEPFNEDHIDEQHPLITRKASVTTASSSVSSNSIFSIVQKPEQSTGPTSAEEERKFVEERPSLPVAPLRVVQEKDIKSGGPSKPTDKPFAPAPSANSVPPLLPTQPSGVGTQTTTVTEPKPTPAPAPTLKPLPIPKAPPANPPTLSQPTPGPVSGATIPAAWQPLITTLRSNKGRLPSIKLPVVLLKSFPDAYKKAGSNNYTKYIQKAMEAGVVKRIVLMDGSQMIVLTDTYYRAV